MASLTMESLKSKPPKSVVAFYVRLFNKKRKSMSSEESPCIQKALKSWFSLSANEQQLFIDKFKKCEDIYKQECASYLKTVEPFLKRKVLRYKVNNVHIIQEPEENEIANTSQLYADDNHLERDSPDNLISATDLDIDQQKEIKITEEIQIQPEPTPPYMKNGKELFEAVNNTTDKNNLQWKDLSQIERRKYRSAVLAIKRDYMKNYHKYLESLSSKELFQHYIKSIEKYLMGCLLPITIDCLLNLIDSVAMPGLF